MSSAESSTTPQVQRSREPEPFIPLAPHHAYLGIVMMIFGILMMLANWNIFSYLSTIILGFLIFLDDLIEHTKTGDTPLRRFFEKVLLRVVSK